MQDKMEQQTKTKATSDKDILEKVKELLNKEWVWMVVDKDTHYVVEVNKGIYLFKYRIGGFGFTDDIKRATLFEYNNYDEANDEAIKCGGKLTKYVITHEVF